MVSLLGCLCLGAAVARAESPPFTVEASLFDPSQPDTLGLAPAPGAETVTVFRPGEGDNAYNHGVVLMPFRGSLYAMWQTSRRDEDAPDTHVVYSRSRDGVHWSEPVVLAEAWDSGIRTSGGWWTAGETLVAYINVWPDRPAGPRGGHTEYRISRDGVGWSAPAPVLDATDRPVRGIIEQDPRALPGGRILTAFHMQPGLVVSPWYTDDPSGTRGWTRGAMRNLPFDGDTSRALEPSWFRRSDGAVVMVFRDQAGSHRKLAAVSSDRGEHWTPPRRVDMPDSRSKQCAGNLPDGTAYLVGNPTRTKNRYPLVITLSRTGNHFDRAYLLRAGGVALPPLRTPGRYKRPGYSYPKSVIWREQLFIGYATNKEDVEMTRIPLTSHGGTGTTLHTPGSRSRFRSPARRSRAPGPFLSRWMAATPRSTGGDLGLD